MRCFSQFFLRITLRNILIGMGYQKSPVDFITNNLTADSFADNNVQLKYSKVWDMQLHWLRYQQTKTKFNVSWKKSSTNGVDYSTKMYPTTYYRNIRKIYLYHHIIKQTKKLNNIISSASSG